MPPANRYFVPGHVYHLTHRRHNRQFLLKFARDRNDYRQRLRHVLTQFDLRLLDYCEISNHVHLLSRSESPDRISRFMQALEGQFAQAYNRRKNRSGKFWSDRFHATIIQPGAHLMRCMVYIALNMRRCGVVVHPRSGPGAIITS